MEISRISRLKYRTRHQIGLIADASQIKFFLKYGDYRVENTSDFELISPFRRYLARSHVGPRFFVLHLYGSHPDACERTSDYPLIFAESSIPPKYREINCYISSIKKTDYFLARIFEILQQHSQTSGRSFSMIYFSDHGLSHNESGGVIHISNAQAIGIERYQVPLFRISSDDKEHQVYHVFKSGLNFLEGIANWVGIRAEGINSHLNLFNNRNDDSDYGQWSRINVRGLEDPAIEVKLWR